ncbi:hypothetical protein GCM10025865_20520 [Paraoerskovia sediminicola]|uniref:NTP pyrophosphohydrolase MazG-like domain-containing protein n=1 Tax=Paraoerskovia sediminicola TaxID=1138587 RepID=A0ABM8G3X8_9CELL|nr:MazG family protein [Paraoerskovia sediminicola]BDZ42753.1 hypothetical protein GCM10025865_20520 [Paraoerskovia sediminicola]
MIDRGEATPSDTGGPGTGAREPDRTTAEADPLRDVVAVMDRLYSPGGCPWDAEQTHESLVRYLLEESYELAEAIEAGTRADVREELGDVLLQVLFHARIAADHPDDPFTVDDVAADLAAKLRRRHPHVFEDAVVTDLHRQWDAVKQAEKQRESVLDGIPRAQGALARAQKVLGRAGRSGIPVDLVTPLVPDGGPSAGRAGDLPDGQDGGGQHGSHGPHDYGSELLALVGRAAADGVDAEGALRATVDAVEAQIRAAEQVPGDREHFLQDGQD